MKRRWHWGFTLVIAAGTACSSPTEPATVMLSFQGTVTERQSGVPLEGVHIHITAGGFRCLFPPCTIAELETDASGGYSYAASGPEQCQFVDTWRITVEKEGFFPESTELGDILC